VFIEAKDDGGGGDNWTTGAISRAKLQSNQLHQQTNILFLQAGCPSCLSVANQAASDIIQQQASILGDGAKMWSGGH